MSHFPEAKTKLTPSRSQMLSIEIQESRYVIQEFHVKNNTKHS
nr:hypothetical protein [uncultured Flavobacterium sp.]